MGGRRAVRGATEVATAIVDRRTRLMEEIVYPAVPERVSSVASVGPSGFRPDEVAEGEITLTLAPAAERRRSNVEVARDLRRRLEGRVPGMTVRVRAPQGQFLLDRLLGGDDEGLAVEVRGYDLATLDVLAARAAEAIRGVRGITDVEMSRDVGVPQEMLRIDRDKAADLGLIPAACSLFHPEPEASAG